MPLVFMLFYNSSEGLFYCSEFLTYKIHTVRACYGDHLTYKCLELGIVKLVFPFVNIYVQDAANLCD